MKNSTLILLTIFSSCSFFTPKQESIQMDVVWKSTHESSTNLDLTLVGNRIYGASTKREHCLAFDSGSGHLVWKTSERIVPESNIVAYGGYLFIMEQLYESLSNNLSPRIIVLGQDGTFKGHIKLMESKWHMDMQSFRIIGDYLYWPTLDPESQKIDFSNWEGGLARLDLRTVNFDDDPSLWTGKPEMLLHTDPAEYGQNKRFMINFLTTENNWIVNFGKISRPGDPHRGFGRILFVDPLSFEIKMTLAPEEYWGNTFDGLHLNGDQTNLFTSDADGFRSFKMPEGTLLWHNPGYYGKGVMAQAGDVGYYTVGNRDNYYDRLLAMNLKTGEILWTSDSFPYSTDVRPLYKDGIVYMFAGDGTYLFDGDTGKLFGVDHNLTGDPWQISNIIEHEGDVFIRDNYNLYRVKLNYRKDAWGNAVK